MSELRHARHRSPRGADAALLANERACRSFDVALAHEAFADEKSRDANRGQVFEIGGGEDPALADGDTAGRNPRRQTPADGERRLERLEVSIVDANERRAHAKRPFELGFVVHFQEGIHAECLRGLLELLRGGVVDRGQDDQDAVGAPCPRLGDLINVIHEILAQDRELGRGARCSEMFRLALKGGRVGEHREASRAPAFVGARQGRRVELRPDQPFGGARFLDLGDQGIVARREFAPDRGRKTARSRSRSGIGLDRGQGTDALGRRNLFAFVGLDLDENVRHGGLTRFVSRCGVREKPSCNSHAFEIVTRRWSRFAASPESIDAWASASAPLRSLARAATISAAAALRIEISWKAPPLPLSTWRSACAFSLALPPRSASGLTRFNPNSSGVISNVRTAPLSRAAT